MSFKTCLIAFISALCLSFPQNIIGCADTGDPDNYFTSFFSKALAGETEVYRPFYYTSLLTFYDDQDWDVPVSYENDKVIQEWKDYCGAKASLAETAHFIYATSQKDVSNILQHVVNNKALQVPDSIRTNALTQCFISQKAVAPLTYLAFAKKIESISITSTPWEEVPPRDSLLLNKYITEANQSFNASTDAFLKNKYAYQRCKIAFYNNRYKDCIKWYDEYFNATNTAAVNGLALSYKAGSLYHLGNKKEAAYHFAKAFQFSDHNKKQNYLGFLWATERCTTKQKDAFIAQAQTVEDKALLLALFALHGSDYRLPELEQVYSLHPTSSLLPLLITREVNKMEEQYLTPMLTKEEGGKPYYFGLEGQRWEDAPNKEAVTRMIPFLEKLYKEGKAVNKELYATSAAYLAFITKDFAKAKAYVKDANKLANTQKVKDQLQLINLLIAANEKEVLDAKTEASLLPSLNWLIEKARKEESYTLFLQNFFSQILAQKYEQQKEVHKAALAYGIADMAFLQKEINEYSSSEGLQFVRYKMATDQLLKLHQFITTASSSYDQFLTKHTSFSKDQVVDVIGTSYLRDHDLGNAVEWLKKTSKPSLLTVSNYNYATDKETIINVNPLHDYLNDWQRYDKPIAKPYTKLSLAQKLIELQQKADTAQAPDAKARIYYQLGSAFYNMSYYGNSWMAVAYHRTGSDWNSSEYTLPWQKQYYGVQEAKDYYQKAYTLSQDKEFKAAAYFLLAKCAQRQIPLPSFSSSGTYESYEKAQLAFEKKFKNNALFPQFVKEFGTTKFYQYTYNRCSYLRDFVSKQNKASSGKK